MPTFDDAITTSASTGDVWALLNDPSRFPQWWEGIATVEPGDSGNYTMYPDGYPDYPMAQVLDAVEQDNRATVNCLVSDLVFEWRLAATDDAGARIVVHVDIPEAEAARLDTQRDIIAASLRNLAAVAAGS